MILSGFHSSGANYNCKNHWRVNARRALCGAQSHRFVMEISTSKYPRGEWLIFLLFRQWLWAGIAVICKGEKNEFCDSSVTNFLVFFSFFFQFGGDWNLMDCSKQSTEIKRLPRKFHLISRAPVENGRAYDSYEKCKQLEDFATPTIVELDFVTFELAGGRIKRSLCWRNGTETSSDASTDWNLVQSCTQALVQHNICKWEFTIHSRLLNSLSLSLLRHSEAR